MSASVLYDAPGPRAIARNRAYAVIGTLAVLGVIGASVARLAEKGHFAPEMWDIFNYAGIRQNIADGVVSTLKAFGIAAVGSLLLGVLLAVGRLSEHRPVRWLATAFIEVFRSIPLLITIYAVWVGFLTDHSMWALALGLSLYNGCVQAEVLRAGINSVPRGQREAAYALGLRKTQVMVSVLMPQAVRAMMPTIISQLVVTLKDTSLGFIILYPELLYAARLIASNTQVNGQYPYVSTIIVIGVIYVAMCLVLSALANWIERRGRRAKTGIGTAAAAEPAEAPGVLGGTGTPADELGPHIAEKPHVTKEPRG
ncbi:amino acid ABC transporter permease [Streptomyces somaliensis DSM 40738]|uniref:Amino acid ABC transporter permease n=1 Tax=Streptomyces somaliensis (strain ATCC 33201 / DSM 40738 / JCM 12659 / KCTC 9044 / NCTC 11332 / NRRL B-12077 / IP 733) TaxID=1134445 RepID=A0AA44DCU4_STRE0|nr:amino acid ABC transporter permease [Streptomyces somaliensis]MCQ0024905.1 amino acid ABC transporter permease [Streptomyces somaliensis DSM 40738]NKY14533.1 amino acid ABC transporter permease [Streptomyces somaliensis DSM 40738]